MTQYRGIKPTIVKRKAYYKYSDIKKAYRSAKRIRTTYAYNLESFFKYAESDRLFLKDKFGINSFVETKQTQDIFKDCVSENTNENDFYSKRIDNRIVEIGNQIRELQDKLDKLKLLKECI